VACHLVDDFEDELVAASRQAANVLQTEQLEQIHERPVRSRLSPSLLADARKDSGRGREGLQAPTVAAKTEGTVRNRCRMTQLTLSLRYATI
jgi:hypothetical protein